MKFNMMADASLIYMRMYMTQIKAGKYGLLQTSTPPPGSFF